MHWLKKPRNPIDKSEALYKRVLEFFWRKPEENFVVRMSDRPMSEWEIIPTPTAETMYEVRAELLDHPYGFAGFQYDEEEGYYEYHFLDQVILKVENLNKRQILCFKVLDFCEMDLRTVTREAQALQKDFKAHSQD